MIYFIHFSSYSMTEIREKNLIYNTFFHRFVVFMQLSSFCHTQNINTYIIQYALSKRVIGRQDFKFLYEKSMLFSKFPLLFSFQLHIFGLILNFFYSKIDFLTIKVHVFSRITVLFLPWNIIHCMIYILILTFASNKCIQFLIMLNS